MKTRIHLYFLAAILSVGLNHGLMAASVSESSGQKAETKEKPKSEIDARPLLKKIKLKEGVNVITTIKNGYKFAVKLKKGEAPAWIAIDPSGNEIQTIERKKGAERKVTCWRCFEDKNGDLHCVEIPCPEGTKPWGGGSSLQ